MSPVWQVRTDQQGLPAERQASRQMTAEAYRSQASSGNFLHLAVGATELQPGDNLPVNFHLKSSTNAVRDSVRYFTYLVSALGLCQPAACHVGDLGGQVSPNQPYLSLPAADYEQGTHCPSGATAARARPEPGHHVTSGDQ